MRRIAPERARRLALAAQGFGRPRPTGRVDRRHLRRAMDDMQVLQLDSVNVAVRSHYMPLFSRLGPYRRGLIDELAYVDRTYFEYWGHEASFVPTELYPAFGHRRGALGNWRAVTEMIEEHPGYVEAVEAEVHAHGPLTVGDLTDPGERTNPWWGYGKGKLALEYLFAKGRLNVDRRINFNRHYAAPRLVIPHDLLDAPPLPFDEAYRVLTLSALRGLGIGTAADIADYWRMKVPLLRPILERLVAENVVEQAAVPGWPKPAYLDPGASIPRTVDARAILSPFDPIVWNRDRALRLFGFHYRIEIYVPEPKRQFGYYVYPFLLGDRLVGRVDLKSDRKAKELLVKASWIEDGEDPAEVAPELAQELAVMAGWLGHHRVVIEPRGNLAGRLASLAT